MLDDDKLEHVLRRILSAEDNPVLEVLVIRIAYEPEAAGSRFRRLDRAKTIGGAVERIADPRLRVEGLSAAVGAGHLAPPTTQRGPGPGPGLSHASSRAVRIAHDGWWARILPPRVQGEREQGMPMAKATVLAQANPFTGTNQALKLSGRTASSSLNDLLRQTTYVNAWIARDRDGSNAPIEE